MTATRPSATSPGIEARAIALTPTRSTFAASRDALRALILRDLVVLRKHFGEFVARVLIQPFLLVFVFLYVLGVATSGRRDRLPLGLAV
jgi:ABC-2 type transport system permease protein